ncbi:MAG: GAF domain-containing protein [Candidatus Bipolaricaulis sp.]|nr:GAF domain-containing protein [Candidatus Bipolaricaulis sp.]
MTEPKVDALWEVDADTMSGWQGIVDLMAEICGVPAGLVMRITGNDIEVFVSSRTQGNPYRVGDRERLVGSGLYCEHVAKTHAPLHVPDALADERWRQNPDIKLGMIAYHGYPIASPDGGVFGTICVLDTAPHDLESRFDRLLDRFKVHIEHDLVSIRRAQELEAALGRVQKLEGVLPTCQYCKKIRLPDADEDDPASWIAIETYIRERTSASFSHGICPDCLRKARSGS